MAGRLAGAAVAIDMLLAEAKAHSRLSLIFFLFPFIFVVATILNDEYKPGCRGQVILSAPGLPLFSLPLSFLCIDLICLSSSYLPHLFVSTDEECAVLLLIIPLKIDD